MSLRSKSSTIIVGDFNLKDNLYFQFLIKTTTDILSMNLYDHSQAADCASYAESSNKQ